MRLLLSFSGEMDSVCKPCKQIIVDSDSGIQCDLCLMWFHCKCVGLSESDYEHFRELDCLGYWFCRADKKKVSDFIKRVKNEDKIQSEIKKGIDEIKTVVLGLTHAINKQQDSVKKSFAEVLRSNISSQPQTKIYSTRSRASANQGIMVVPKSGNMSSKDVEKVVKEKVDLVGIKLGVSKLKHMKNSGIFMATPSDVDILEKEVSTKLGEGFKVFKPKAPTPQLVISGISREYGEEELWTEIKETNPGFCSDDSIKVVHRRKLKFNDCQEKWSYIIEANAATYKKLVDRYVTVDFDDHFVKQPAASTVNSIITRALIALLHLCALDVVKITKLANVRKLSHTVVQTVEMQILRVQNSTPITAVVAAIAQYTKIF